MLPSFLSKTPSSTAVRHRLSPRCQAEDGANAGVNHLGNHSAARVGVSIGLASAPRDGVTADELLSAADRAMYDAKRRGKGDFVVHASVVETVPLVPMAKAPALAC
jgi:diguanylate cyclase (GGDEF)-like protein